MYRYQTRQKKSVVFFDGVKLPKNFVLRASVWQDTAVEHLEVIKKNAWPIYMAIPETMLQYMPKKWIACDCENCSTCEKHCFSRKYKNIFVLLHGREAKKLENDIERLKMIVDYLSGKIETMAA